MIEEIIRLLADIAKMYGWIQIGENDRLFFEPGKYVLCCCMSCEFSYFFFLVTLDEHSAEQIVLVSQILVALAPILILFWCVYRCRR